MFMYMYMSSDAFRECLIVCVLLGHGNDKSPNPPTATAEAAAQNPSGL